MKQPLDRLFQCEGYTVSSDKHFHSWIRAPKNRKESLFQATLESLMWATEKKGKTKTNTYPTFRYNDVWFIAIHAILIFWAVNHM